MERTKPPASPTRRRRFDAHGTLITAAAFTPVGFARSAAGEYTFSIFAVVAIALLVSWVVAVLFTPYIGYKLLPDFEHDASRPSLFRRFVHAPLHRRLPRLVPAPAPVRHGDVYDSRFYRASAGWWSRA